VLLATLALVCTQAEKLPPLLVQDDGLVALAEDGTEVD
jgi:hypothetical protein